MKGKKSEKKAEKAVQKKSPTGKEDSEKEVVAIPTPNRVNFHEKASYPSRKDDTEEEPQDEELQEEKKKRTAGVITARTAPVDESTSFPIAAASSSSSSSSASSSSSSSSTSFMRAHNVITSSDEVWNLKCAALAEYCRINNKLPPQKGTVIEIGELGSVELGIWCHTQQKRFKGTKGRTPLVEQQV